ncbi:MAG: hypothetical protein WCB36_10245 [Burkholderiales bacterium]
MNLHYSFSSGFRAAYVKHKTFLEVAMFLAKSNFKFSMKTIVAGIAAAGIVGLSACGGGGTTTTAGGGGGAGVTVSPFSLFASTYIAYAAQTNGAFLRSIQGGDVYAGFGGNLIYGDYSSPQADMNRTGFYNLQSRATAVAPNTAADFSYIAVLAPLNGTFDISTATTLLIQMGNTTPNNSNVFTVDLNNAVGATAATNDCAADVTLRSVGAGPKSALGVSTYAVPLSSFTCSKGTLAALQSGGITTVAVKVVGDKNKAVAPGEYNTIAVGMIGFAGAVSAADQTALGL